MDSIDNHPVLESISSKDEISVLARDLADEYVQFFNVNIELEQEKYQDSIEECLAHLEEVISVLDSYKQNSLAIDGFVEIVSRRQESLDKLYMQVDAMEQYIFESNRLLDQLDIFIGELERHQHAKGGKLQQIIGMLPGVSSMPRIGLFSTFSTFMEDNSPNFVEGETSRADSRLIPIEEILGQLDLVTDSVSSATNELNRRLNSGSTTSKQVQSSFIGNSIADLNLGSNIENVDGSWQELL